MSTTTYMNLELPTVSVTIGPDYAEQNNTAFETLDAHDHTSGKGTKVPTAGLNINANLTFNSKKAYDLASAQFINQASALSGATNARSLSTTNGNLYYVNSSGTSIQITDGGAIVAAPGATTSLEVTTTSTNLGISAVAAYVVILVDTSGGAITVTLPLASAVAAGRIYVIKDATGDANAYPITIECTIGDTIDGETSIDMDSEYGSFMVIGNGATAYSTI